MTTPSICERLRDQARRVEGNGYVNAGKAITEAADLIETQAALFEECERLIFWIVGNSDLTGEINRRARAAYAKLRRRPK